MLIHVGTYTFYGPLQHREFYGEQPFFFVNLTTVCGLNEIEITRIKGNILRRKKDKLCVRIQKKHVLLLSRLYIKITKQSINEALIFYSIKLPRGIKIISLIDKLIGNGYTANVKVDTCHSIDRCLNRELNKFLNNELKSLCST